MTRTKSLTNLSFQGDLSDRTLAAAILESLLSILKNPKTDPAENLDTEKLVSVCRNLELQQLGLLVLESVKPTEGDEEQQPRKRARLEPRTSRKRMSKSEVIATIDLYKSMADVKSARELFLQEMADEVRSLIFTEKPFVHALLERMGEVLSILSSQVDYGAA